jgi:hypothetical protein
MSTVMELEIQRVLKELGDGITRLDSGLARIETFLKGNELDKDDKGLVGRVNSTEERLKSLEKFRDRAIYIGIGMGLPAGIGAWEIVRGLITKLN